ncbi:MAG: TIGR03960 family B12-binding radical SAM protein [Prochlorotrichaceae cyanobacterium]
MPLTVDQLLTTDISRPARYLGTEMGSIHKPWAEAIVRWCLTYPEIYEVGASNLGHIILYNILNTQPRQLCDRSYLPAPDLAAKLREHQTPLFAVESRRSLLEFDILGFSLSYELGATNILDMLDLAGIPLTWQEREEDGQAYPFIFAGGQTATSNPEPYADFFDFIVLGDGEEVLPEIGLVVEEGKGLGLSREALLLDLAQVPGVYVPRFYAPQTNGTVERLRPDVPRRILRRVATPIPAYSVGLVPYVQTVHDRLVMEIRRGCTRGCRFCQPGMLTRPARDVAPEAIVEAMTEGMRQTGYNEFSLLSLSCSDYLALPALGVELKNKLKDENISLSLPSQRVDRFDEDIANIIGGTRQTGITFAPEAGTQRLRDIINKGLTNGELLRGVKTAYQQGWNKMKLYFMVGLPGETDADVIGIAETVRWLRQECRGPKRLSFNITISNFTPKPHTPFQWHSVSTAEFERKHQLLKAEFRGMRGVKVNFTDVRISAMEDFVGRGDRRLASVVRRAWELGAGMDAWWENLNHTYEAWTTAIAEAGLEHHYRELEQGHLCWTTPNPDSLNPDTTPDPDFLATLPLPWDHLDTGIDKRWLAEDLQRALAEATVPDCSFDGCSHCGVCGVDFGHNEVVPPPPIPEFTGHFQANLNRAQRLRVRFGKQGDLRLLSHLDLLRLFDRAIRRAALPIAYSNGYHPMPRMIPASALSLGLTSEGELMDLELTEAVDPVTALQQLQAQFPPDVPIYAVESVTIDSPPITEAIQTATFRVQFTIVSSESETEARTESEPQRETERDLTWVKSWLTELLSRPSLVVELTSKSGKPHLVDLRERLQSLEWGGTSDRHLATQQPLDLPTVVLDYQGHYRNDGNLLRPEHLLLMLETIAQEQDSTLRLDLIHAHRLAIGL